MCVYYMYMCVHTYVYERDVDRSVDCTCVYTHTQRDLFYGIGPYDYGGWQVYSLQDRLET